MRVDALTARSRLTESWVFKLPRFVRRSVSGEIPTVKLRESNFVMVKQVPLMLMLSPSCASLRMLSHLETTAFLLPSSVESKEEIPKFDVSHVDSDLI